MAEPLVCPQCGTASNEQELRGTLFLCPACRAHLPMPARERIALLADAGTFREQGRGLVSVDPLAFTDQRSYRDRVLEARRRTGLRDAAVVGEAQIDGIPAVLIVFEFAFMGGTMGSVVGEKVAAAFDRATRRRLPVISVASSGGARMQEGMLSLMQMAKTAAACVRHDQAGLPYLSVLAHPTFGGVAASFAALGDVLIAERGALIGFVGPRVIESTVGERPPEDSHRAETLLAAGLVDLVVERPRLRETLASLVRHLAAGRRRGRRGEPREPIAAKRRTPVAARARSRRGRPKPSGPSAWEQVQLARRPDRPTTADYIEALTTRFVELHGDRQSGDDPAVIAGVGQLEGHTAVIIGHERGRTADEQRWRRGGMASPEGYRKAVRLMRLAAKFGLPVITFVDTPGARPGYKAEQGGIWQALARCLRRMVALPTPTVTVVIGEGGSGGALAFAVADRVFMLEHAIYSVISPEGAAAILHRDSHRAEDVASALKLTAEDLRRLGIIDQIVPEPPGGAHGDPTATAELVGTRVRSALRELTRMSARKRMRAREHRYRHIGRVGTYWREVVGTEMQELLGALETRLLRRANEPSPASSSSRGAPEAGMTREGRDPTAGSPSSS